MLHFPQPETVQETDGTKGLLCMRRVHPVMVFPPSLASANLDLLHMETEDHLR